MKYEMRQVTTMTDHGEETITESVKVYSKWEKRAQARKAARDAKIAEKGPTKHKPSILTFILFNPTISLVVVGLIVVITIYLIVSANVSLDKLVDQYTSLTARVSNSKNGFDKKLFYVTVNADGTTTVTLTMSSDVQQEDADMATAEAGTSSSSTVSSGGTSLGVGDFSGLTGDPITISFTNTNWDSKYPGLYQTNTLHGATVDDNGQDYMTSLLVAPDGATDLIKNMVAVTNTLAAAGYNKNAIAGVLGNFYAECGYYMGCRQGAEETPSSNGPMSNEEVVNWASGGAAKIVNNKITGDFKNGKAIGVLQWDGGTAKEIVQAAIDKGVQWYDANFQCEYILTYMKASYQASDAKTFNENANSVEQATYYFASKDERCALKSQYKRGRTHYCASQVSYDEREEIGGWEKRCGIAIFVYENILK